MIAANASPAHLWALLLCLIYLPLSNAMETQLATNLCFDGVSEVAIFNVPVNYSQVYAIRLDAYPGTLSTISLHRKRVKFTAFDKVHAGKGCM